MLQGDKWQKKELCMWTSSLRMLVYLLFKGDKATAERWQYENRCAHEDGIDYFVGYVIRLQDRQQPVESGHQLLSGL